LQDTGLVALWWLGQADVDDEHLTGESWWTLTGYPSKRLRCVWRQTWTDASPSHACEACDFAFDLTLDAPTVYDGQACDAGDVLRYSSGDFRVDEVVEAHVWRAGVGFASTATNLLHEQYGWGDGDLLYAYDGSWYVAYWAYASHDDPSFAWGEYWGRGYYYDQP